MCVCSNQCSHFESQSFVDGCMSTDMAWGNILAPASRWSSITFILWPIHLHWGADSAYSPGKKQDVMQNGCVCNTCYLYLPSLSQNVEQGLWLRFCTTASRSQRLLYWWADLSTSFSFVGRKYRGKSKDFWSLEEGGWAETPGGAGTATKGRWNAQGQHMQRATYSWRREKQQQMVPH